RCPPRSTVFPYTPLFRSAYGVALVDWAALGGLDAAVLAVPHGAYLAEGGARISSMLAPGAVVVDVRSAIDPASLPEDVLLWRLRSEEHTSELQSRENLVC